MICKKPLIRTPPKCPHCPHLHDHCRPVDYWSASACQMTQFASSIGRQWRDCRGARGSGAATLDQPCRPPPNWNWWWSEQVRGCRRNVASFTCETHSDSACRPPGQSPSSTCTRNADRARKVSLEMSETFVFRLLWRSFPCPTSRIRPIGASFPRWRLSLTGQVTAPLTSYKWQWQASLFFGLWWPTCGFCYAHCCGCCSPGAHFPVPGKGRRPGPKVNKPFGLCRRFEGTLETITVFGYRF